MNEQPIIKPVDFFLGLVTGALLTGVIAFAMGYHSIGHGQNPGMNGPAPGAYHIDLTVPGPTISGPNPGMIPVSVGGVVIDENGVQLPAAKNFTATVLSTYKVKVNAADATYNMNQPPNTTLLTATYKTPKSTFYSWLNTTASSQIVNIDFDQKGNGPLLDIDCSADKPNLAGYSIVLVQGASAPVTLTANANLHYTSPIQSGQPYSFALVDASGDTMTDIYGANIVGSFTAPATMDKYSTFGYNFTFQ